MNGEKSPAQIFDNSVMGNDGILKPGYDWLVLSSTSEKGILSGAWSNQALDRIVTGSTNRLIRLEQSKRVGLRWSSY